MAELDYWTHHVSELDREVVKKLRVQISYKVTLMNYFQLVILLQSQIAPEMGMRERHLLLMLGI